MMNPYKPYLDSITKNEARYLALLKQWSLVDSQTYNLAGLDEMIGNLQKGFDALDPEVTAIGLDNLMVMGPDGRRVERRFGRALRFRKRPEAPFRVFLCGHMDTVLKPIKRPDEAIRPGDGTMWGTGVTDAKGGLVVMLAALECLEGSPYARELGWEALIVPDEEVGSLGSKPLLQEAAKGFDLGLLFEPAQPDGSLVGERMGSGTFSATVRGRAAHAGRHIEQGRNAIEALAELIVGLRDFQKDEDQIRINVGVVEGGGPLNVVPDLARCRFNVRVRTVEAMKTVQEGIERISARVGEKDGISVEITGGFGRPPKPLNREIHYLLKQLVSCGRDLNLDLGWRWSGGVCDGNTLLAAGLPNVDSLGPVGDGLHTGEEFVAESSVVERASLVALFLMKLACREIPWPPPDDAGGQP